MLKIFSILIASGIIVSCNSNHSAGSHDQQNNSSVPKTRSDSLYKETMAGHDLGMGKMGEIVRYQKAIIQKTDSLRTSNVKGTDFAPALDSALQALNEAEQGMNDWMQSFDPDKAGNTEVEKVKYYHREKEKIEAVNTSILNSIETAKKVLE
ncbi:MAG TPA: hypothetical protein VFV68_14565 [Agriterribacter sp.]|nr:hypothetical protein [Agriterribacter sp.]